VGSWILSELSSSGQPGPPEVFFPARQRISRPSKACPGGPTASLQRSRTVQQQKKKRGDAEGDQKKESNRHQTKDSHKKNLGYRPKISNEKKLVPGMGDRRSGVKEGDWGGKKTVIPPHTQMSAWNMHTRLKREKGRGTLLPYSVKRGRSLTKTQGAKDGGKRSSERYLRGERQVKLGAGLARTP